MTAGRPRADGAYAALYAAQFAAGPESGLSDSLGRVSCNRSG